MLIYLGSKIGAFLMTFLVQEETDFRCQTISGFKILNISTCHGLNQLEGLFAYHDRSIILCPTILLCKNSPKTGLTGSENSVLIG